MSREAWRTAACWAVATLAFLTRTAGLAVLAAWVVEALLRRRFRTAALRLALALVPVLAWQGFIAHVESQPTYAGAYSYARADYAFYNVSYVRNNLLIDAREPGLGHASASDLVSRVARNAAATLPSVGGAVLTSEQELAGVMTRLKTTHGIGRFVPWRAIPAGLSVFGIVVIVGMVLLFRSGHVLLVSTLVLYVGQLCLLSTTWYWPRYLMEISPLVVVAFLIAVFTAASKRAAWLVVGAVLCAEVAMLGWMFTQSFGPVLHRDWHGHRVEYRLFSYDRSFEALDASLDWLDRHRAAGDVVVSSMAPWVYLRAGLHAVMPPLEHQAERAEALIDSVPARYVVVDRCGYSFTLEYARPVVRADGGRWRLVHATPDGLAEVYERQRPARGAAPGRAATRPTP